MDRIISFEEVKNKAEEHKSTLSDDQLKMQAALLFNGLISSYANSIQLFDNGNRFRQFMQFIAVHNIKISFEIPLKEDKNDN